MKPRFLVGAFVLTLLLLASGPVGADVMKHNFICSDCHFPGTSFSDLGNSNICIRCHMPAGPMADYDPFDGRGSLTPVGVFEDTDASDAMGSATAAGIVPGPGNKQTSHFWAADGRNLEAGAPGGKAGFYNTYYQVNQGKVYCSVCHDPHGGGATSAVATTLARNTDTDAMCLDCHNNWIETNATNTDAIETHPLIPDYAAVVADTGAGGKNEFGKFQTFAASGQMALVSNGLSCTTCHGVHWTDSDSTTDDTDHLAGNFGDGTLLRADGPSVTGGTRNGGTGTAQRRSNLCQACHTYEMHGKGAVGDHQIGCLECHGGHSNNGGTPSAFVLRADNTDVPTHIDGSPTANASVTFGTYTVGGSSRTKWSDDTNGTANGYCEKCHGDVQDPANIGTSANEHLEGDVAECTTCHKHSGTGWTHSFQVDASAASCGACHGFPPYLPGRGDRPPGGTGDDGGYAYNYVDTVPVQNWNYFDDSGYFKDESTTAHNTHAGNDNDPNYYFVGSAGIENCQPCHGPDAGSGAGGHREPGDTETFRDVFFNDVATGKTAVGSAILTPVYNTGPATCDSVYCHSNGGKRNASGTKVLGDFTVTPSPGWDGGKDAIFTQPNRCNFCHGNDSGTMTTKDNSVAHNKHLDAPYSYDCSVCHVDTASSSTALQAGATNGRAGGKHVNSAVDVDFDATFMSGALSGESYGSVAGTCSVYCHDPSNTANTADWDVAGPLGCADCHDGRPGDATVIATGAHTIHIDPAKADIACADCHGAGADAGSHTGHVDGTPDVVAGICDTCHGVENSGPAWDVTPDWNDPASEDCRTCHTGAATTSYTDKSLNAIAAPDKGAAVTTGHNLASGFYPDGLGGNGNSAANSLCEDCHVSVTLASRHVDGLGNGMRLRTDGTFPATYAGSENVFCDSCHGSSGTATVTNINTHQVKTCVACHDPHGDDSGNDNIMMVRGDNATDYNGTVRFKIRGDSASPLTATDSYDEDDDGSAATHVEDNADDICATCHTVAGTSAHNNSDNSAVDHNMGADCFDCHSTHTDVTNAFGGGAGNACNSCHDFPPATGAHLLHAVTGSNYKEDGLPTFDVSDCGRCHGNGGNNATFTNNVDNYTYIGEGDQSGTLRHGHDVDRFTILTETLGYNSVDKTCANACHSSTVGDGAWDDPNGIACNACHFYSATPNAGDTPTGLSVSHDEHFDKTKVCTDCHSLENSGNPLAGPLSHISDTSGASDALKIAGMAAALQDEAAIDFTGQTTQYTFTDAAPNTCSSATNNGLGCHATGAPAWDNAIPATSAGCEQCHTDTDNGLVNPTSGLHDNNPGGPTVTGESHDGSFDTTADCVTCHTTSPTATASNHINGTLNSGAAINVNPAGGTYTPGSPGTCTTSCHSAGATWEYLWDTTVYNNDGTECANCHGDYNAWNTGVIHATFPTRGSKHNNVGSLSYPCMDCHAIGSINNPNYAFTSGTHDWNAAAGETSHHGDGIITMNDSAVNAFVPDNTAYPGSGYAGCTTTSCHDNDDAHAFPQTATALSTGTVVGDDPEVLCSGCHGGTAASGDILGYWPDDTGAPVDNTTEDNAGAHTVHVTKIAKQFLGQADLTELLTDSVGTQAPFNTWTANDKQLHLCSFCHGTLGGDPYGTLGDPLSDGTHGNLVDLPADVSGMYQIWDGGADAGGYAAGSCSNVNCHNNKTTPATNEWYDAAGNGNCAMCHVDIPTESGHAPHLDAGIGVGGDFGRNIVCADCHDGATDWATNAAPNDGDHIDGALQVQNGTVIDGSVVTYSGGTCGVNACHNDGSGSSQASNPTWNTAQSNCTICHAGTPATGAHVVHVNNSAFVPNSCTDCHTDATTSTTGASHLDGTIDTGGNESVVYTAAAGTCTNSCHGGATVDFRDSSPNIGCTDCHGGGFIGDNGGAYMPQYNMHPVTPVTSGKVHTDALVACGYCHDSISGLGTHINGVWTVDDADNSDDQDRGLFTAFSDAATPSCSGAGVNQAAGCHLDDGAWARKWDASAGVNDATRCANCHGDYSGWITGVIHADRPAFGNSAHSGVGDLSYACTDCHVIGATTGAYTFTDSSNDWNVGTAETSHHGNDALEINSKTATHGRSGGRGGCTGCHEGATGTQNAHDFPASAWTVDNTLVGDDEAAAGGCTICHGGGGGYWPNNAAGPDNTLGDTTSPDGAGKHEQHMVALTGKLYPSDFVPGNSAATIANLTSDNGNGTADTKQRAICEYCHAAVSNDGDHGVTANLPAEVFLPNGGGRKANNVWGVADADATFNSGAGTCSTVDCHFNNAITPHWYADTTPPAEVTLTAETGTEPKSIRVYWNAPGDDGIVADTTPYVYDMRYGKTIGEALDYAVTANNYVGGMPSAYKQGELTEVIVENLDPATTYHFSMRTRDTAGNWSTLPVSTVNALSSTDSQAPDFGGINKASTADVSSAINLVWTAAEDHSMPMTYKIWQKVYDPENLLDMDVDLPLVSDWKDHSYQATGLTDDTVYTFGVRACDANALCEVNTQTSSAVAKLPLTVPKVASNYISEGLTTLVLDGTPGGGAANQPLPLVFAPGANAAATTDYFVDSFSVELYSNSGGAVTLEVGTSTDGTNFTAFPEGQFTKTVNMARKARRLVTFKIADSTGKQIVESAARIAVQLSGSATASYGSSTTGGILSVGERLFNVPPSNPSLNAVVNGAKVDMTWTQVDDTVDGVNDDALLHYDIYGSIDNGATWDYLVATDLPVTDVAYSWNTQDSGLDPTSQLAVQLRAGDSFDHYTAAGSSITDLTIDNSADLVAPFAPSELTAEKRPKSGTVWLTWSSPGDDEGNHGRAERYDIVYATVPINDGNFYDSPATTTEVYGEPTPDFGGTLQSYEVTGLDPGTNYYFAVKAVDEGGNISTVSTAKDIGTDQQVGGPRCGMCHTTAPSVVSSVGNHKLHGFTLNQCDKCHDNGTLAPSDYGLDHQDGKLEMGFGPGKAHEPNIDTVPNPDRIYYTDDGTPGGTVIYDDTDGFGGFGAGDYATQGDGTDNGNCSSFGALGVGGCHGPAGDDPDGGGPLPTYLPAPNWNAAATLDCSLCHGNPDRVTDFYGRSYDGHVDAAVDPQNPLPGEIPDQILGAPTVDNHGNWDPAAATPAERKYIGQHEKHLNYSFRFSKGDSCSLCHKGDYADRLDLDSRHGNGDIDVVLDPIASGPDAVWNPGADANTPGSCASMSPETCHPNAATPNWDSAETFDCVGCHSMGGSTPGHTTDTFKGITNDEPGGDTDVPGFVPGAKVVPGNCMYCHFGGHPRDDVGGEALILENNPQVGMDYRSGGVHLRASIGGRAAVTTEAELCWSCHQDNGISEWGADDGTWNTETAPTKAGTNTDYDYGSVTGGTYADSWITSTPGQGSMWTSGTPAFGYKTERIQSTHSTSVSGSSILTGTDYAYNEAVDAIDVIRCSNCHDVHDLNKATADTSSGTPYLRGSWKRNPYKEDGAPMSGTTYAAPNTTGGYSFGPVPRGGTTYVEMGGYQIDQNNNNPTAGWALSTSAGLCTLCHNPAGGIDAMDKELGESLWLGTNGHANSAIGGSTAGAANIFTTDIRNPTRIPTTPWSGISANGESSGAPVMGWEHMSVSVKYGIGIRGYSGRYGRGWDVGDPVPDQQPFRGFDWGVSQEDSTAVDAGYHAFSCSKCHNPHASRLPKLMITNCLDINHNTWDDSYATTTGSNQDATDTLSADNENVTLSSVTSAQNCHRYKDRQFGNSTGDGWNKVTPWQEY